MEHKLAKGTIYLTFSKVGDVFSNYLIHIALARLLGPEVYGNFGIILSLILITKTIFLTGFYRAISKYVSENKNKVAGIFRASFKILLVYSIICIISFFIFSQSIANFFNEPSLAGIIFFSSFIALTEGFSGLLTAGIMNGLLMFREQAKVNLFDSFFKIIIALALVFFGFGLFGALTAYILAPLFASVVALIIIKGKLSGEHKEKFSKTAIIKFTLPLSIFFFSMTLLTDSSLLLVKNILIDDKLTGLYASALTFGKLLLSLGVSLQLTILPSVSSAIADNNFELIKKYIKQSMRYSIMFLLPLTLLISTHAEQILAFFYSNSFIGGAVPLSILVLGFAFFSLFMTQCSILFGANKPKVALLIVILTLISSYALNVKLIPLLGLYGAAVATTITAFFGLVLASIYIFVKFKALISLRSFLNITLASLITYFFAYFWNLPGKLFFISLSLLSVLYILLLVILKEIKDEDKEIVKFLLKRSKG